MFESNADHLGPDLFAEFVLPYLKEINERVKCGIHTKGLGKIPMVCIIIFQVLCSVCSTFIFILTNFHLLIDKNIRTIGRGEYFVTSGSNAEPKFVVRDVCGVLGFKQVC